MIELSLDQILAHLGKISKIGIDDRDNTMAPVVPAGSFVVIDGRGPLKLARGIWALAIGQCLLVRRIVDLLPRDMLKLQADGVRTVERHLTIPRSEVLLIGPLLRVEASITFSKEELADGSSH